MPLPPASAERERFHHRRTCFEGFRRSDGLWDIEARLVDIKDHPLDLKEEIRAPGQAVHDLSVRITIDTQMNVLDIVACSDATPFPEICGGILPDYRQVIGLNLFKGFVKEVKNRFAGVQGCSHITELLMAMPTAAFQTFSGLKHEEGRSEQSDKPPHHLDRCHALALDSETVRRFYPRWYRKRNPEVIPD